MDKKELLSLLEEIENDRRKNRYFEKVSLEEFTKGVKKCNGDLSDGEIEKLYENLKYPSRSTVNAGCYDFFVPYDFVVKPGETKLVATGFKVHMNTDETFNIVVRSGTGVKYNVRLSNQIGIIDADYYGNDGNEGHIFISYTNHGSKDWCNLISENSKIVQGFFMQYHTTRDDKNLNIVRKGGFGSTSKVG